jgi:hypothetical protein
MLERLDWTITNDTLIIFCASKFSRRKISQKNIKHLSMKIEVYIQPTSVHGDSQWLENGILT